MFKLLHWSLWLLSIFLMLGCKFSSEKQATDLTYEYDITRTIKTVDEIDLTYHLDVPNTKSTVSLVLIIDGSSCRGPKLSLFDIMRPNQQAPLPYARLIVEKIGVGLEDSGETCSDLFLQNYSIEERVLQHLRVLQHVRNDAPWWNGDLLIWGWSDGGDIATRLTAYYPNTIRAVLGGMGGGFTMEEHFKDFFSCRLDNYPTAEERQPCLDRHNKLFADIRNNPTWQKTWSGDDNSYKVWETRLFARLSILLKNNTVPILIVHGEKDKYGTPVQSARKLINDLKFANNTAFTYWEIPDMKHFFGPNEHDKRIIYLNAMRDWLLKGEGEQPKIFVQEPEAEK